METESGAKIAIRGKGSVKEGKGRSDAAHASNQEEDLHCLIMADTEDKVNKAKKLIHNVIETVSVPCFVAELTAISDRHRLPRFPKAKTNSSAISFVNWQLSTEHSVMMKTRLVRTVARSVTASTTVRRSRTSLPASSVACVVMQVTWLATVPTGREARTGATTLLVADLRLALVEERPMPITRYVTLIAQLLQTRILTGPLAIHGRDRWRRGPCAHRGRPWAL